MLELFKNLRQSNEDQIDELLSAYLDGMLTSDEQATLGARLRREPALRNRLEGLRLTASVLKDLPEVKIPRNFILSPSMVAPPRPAPRPRRRQAWPVFGWATAAVTLLFLLAFAGDVFVVAPSLHPQPTVMVREELPRAIPSSDRTVPPPEAAALTEKEGAPETEAPAESAEYMAVATEEVEAEAKAVEVVVEGEVVITLEAEAPMEMMEPDTATAAEAPAATVLVEPSEAMAGGGEAPADEEDERMYSAPTPPEEGTPMSLRQATPEPAAAEVGQAVITTPEAAAEGAPVLVSPPQGWTEEAGEYELETTVQEFSTPDAVALVPLHVTPEVEGTEPVAERVMPWLRLLELALGLTVVGLAAATVITRRRGV